MSGWGRERVPITLAPMEGEALDSWLTAYAHQLVVPAGQFVRFLGLPSSSPGLMVRQLTDEERDVLSRRTGIEPSVLTRMTLEPWNGSTIVIKPGSRKLGRPPEWMFSGNQTRYCPACLEADSGRWQLCWRLPWTFACIRHRLLLIDRCPRCLMPPITHRYAVMSEPGVCLRVRSTARCGFPLAKAPAMPVPDGGRVLTAQREINGTVLGPSHNAGPVRARARELAVLAQRTLPVLHTHLDSAPEAVRQVVAECGGTVPEPSERGAYIDTHSCAVSTAIACSALEPGSASSGGSFAWLLESSREASGATDYPITYVHKWWAHAGPRIAAQAMASVDDKVSWATRVRYGTTTSEPMWTSLTGADVLVRAARMPSMLWPSWTMRVLPDAECASSLAGFRRAAAALMLLPGSQVTFRQAARLLGNVSPASYWVLLQKIMEGRDATVLTSAVVLLARALDEQPPPIDYQRRRALFSNGEIAFDAAAYHAYCRRQGGVHATDAQVERMRWRVRALLLGAEPGSFSRTPGRQANSSHLLDHELKALVLREAEVNLHSHGVTEPLAWEPPGSWLPDLAWPGVDPGQIDESLLATLMPARPSLEQVAHSVGVGREHIRLYFESVWTTGPSVPAIPSPRRGQGTPLPLQGVLAPDELQRLYHDEHMSMRQIAELAGCSTGAVNRILRDAGIRSRRRDEPMCTAQGAPITAAWLEQEYVHKARTTIDIAEELETYSSQVSQMLKRHGIPARRLFAPSSALLGLETPLSPAMRAVTKTHNHVQRLRHLVQLPGHLHIGAAAKAMGLTHTSISYQLNRIEEAVGFALIGRYSRPLIATPEGRTFFAEAERLLEMLTHAEPPSKLADAQKH